MLSTVEVMIMAMTGTLKLSDNNNALLCNYEVMRRRFFGTCAAHIFSQIRHPCFS